MQETLTAEKKQRKGENLTPEVTRISHQIVNSYLVSDPDTGDWVLVDAGLKTSARHIRRAAEERFGPTSRPEAIILTHGHFDHIGALEALSEYWDVPIYAHALEFPYLTGRCSYPPADPTVGGGMMSVMSAFFTRGPADFSDRLKPLPSNGKVPGLASWRWIATPGHSPGHISLFEPDSRTLIVGDAFVTTRQESAIAVLTKHTQVNGPPAYFTPDWASARDSVQMLASLKPKLAATGHGNPMGGKILTHQLKILAENFERDAMPARGRYVGRPAVADEKGIIYTPPAVTGTRNKKIAAASLGILAIAAIASVWQRRRTFS